MKSICSAVLTQYRLQTVKQTGTGP